MTSESQNRSGTESRRSYRVLVIDDNVQIHGDFRKVLSPVAEDKSLNDRALEAFDLATLRASSNTLPVFELDFAFNGESGFGKVCEAVQQRNQFALAFVDVRMPPGWDGIQTISRILEVDSKIQFVICTAYSDYSIEDIISSLGLSDRVVILRKPFDPGELQSLAIALTQRWSRDAEFSRIGKTQSMTLERAAALLNVTTKENESLVKENQIYAADAKRLNAALEESHSQINAAKNALMVAITKVVESRDGSIGLQLRRIQSSSQLIAKRLQQFGAYQHLIDEDFLTEFHRSTPLYDVGKIGIPDGIFLKAGSLSDVEFKIMEQHVSIGHKLITSVAQCYPDTSVLDMAAEIARYHHEAWDGSGYPDGLVGEEIPLPARIVAVADSFDAMTSQRLYRAKKTDFEARCEIEAETGKRFDPEVANAFRAVFNEICEARRKITDTEPAGMLEQG